MLNYVKSTIWMVKSTSSLFLPGQIPIFLLIALGFAELPGRPAVTSLGHLLKVVATRTETKILVQQTTKYRGVLSGNLTLLKMAHRNT